MMEIARTSYVACCAHQIEGHPKCGRIHGHNYEITVTLTGDINPKTGMILDYAVLDEIVKPIVDAMDHRYIISDSNINKANPFAGMAKKFDQSFRLNMPASTAECIALFLAKTIYLDLAGRDIVLVVTVEVRETPKSLAVAHHYDEIPSS